MLFNVVSSCRNFIVGYVCFKNIVMTRVEMFYQPRYVLSAFNKRI